MLLLSSMKAIDCLWNHVQNSELSECVSRRLVPTPGRIFFAIEVAEELPTIVDADLSTPLLVLRMPVHASISRGSNLISPSPHVIRSRAQAKILFPIIETIAIDMVNVLSCLRVEDKAMEINVPACGVVCGVDFAVIPRRITGT